MVSLIRGGGEGGECVDWSSSHVMKLSLLFFAVNLSLLNLSFNMYFMVAGKTMISILIKFK